jgi:hypothetical protein
MRDEIDPHASVNVLAEDEDGFWYNRNTSPQGRKSWARARKWWNEFTKVSACEWCGKFGNVQRVRRRDDCWRFELQGYKHPPRLCMGCWNKLRGAIRRFDALMELKSITRKLRNVKREHDHRRSSNQAARRA